MLFTVDCDLCLTAQGVQLQPITYVLVQIIAAGSVTVSAILQDCGLQLRPLAQTLGVMPALLLIPALEQQSKLFLGTEAPILMPNGVNLFLALFSSDCTGAE